MKQKIFRFFADLRFAIFILLVISFCSIIGTIIEQDQSIETYKINYPLLNPIFGVFSWERILKLGLDHIYKTWWFITLVFLFGLSLTLCSILQQLPSLKIARRCQFFRITEQFYKLRFSTILDNLSFNNMLFQIRKKNYSVFQQRNVIYSYKGLVGRIAPIIVHFSMILILSGTIFGSLFGFKAQEIIPITENFHIQNVLSNGPLTKIPQTTVRVNSFWITYTRQNTISQFYSDLSVLNKIGNEIHRETIRVNVPLIYKNIYYYQTDWNLIGLRFQNFEREVIEYPLNLISNNRNKIWATWVFSNKNLNTNLGIFIIIDNLEGYCSVYDETNQFLGNIELNEKNKINSQISFLEIICSTGLQIKADPGIVIIYIGFFFLMLSTLISYITYSQIWVIKKNRQIFIGGTTNRAIFEFELEFFELAK